MRPQRHADERKERSRKNGVLHDSITSMCGLPASPTTSCGSIDLVSDSAIPEPCRSGQSHSVR